MNYNSGGAIADKDLPVSDAAESIALCLEIACFAMTFDGYELAVSIEIAAAIAHARRPHPETSPNQKDAKPFRRRLALLRRTLVERDDLGASAAGKAK